MASGAQEGQHVLRGPPLTEVEVAGVELPLAPYLVQKLAAHGDRLLQVVTGQELRAEWVLRQAAAELSALQRAVPSLREGDTVAVCCRKSVLFLPAVVATLCSGAVCAVVNADLPLESLRRALQELRPAAVMCERPTAETASAARPPGCPLQVLGAAEAVPDSQQVLLSSAQALQGDNLRPAIALLTSGTTGQPKVIRIPHRSIALMVHLLTRSDAPFGGEDVMLFTTGLYWISGIAYTVWCMSSGMRCIVTSDFSPEAVLEDIERYKATAIFMPPNQWISLARHCPEGRLRSAVQQVRVCITGGSALSAERHAWVEARTGRPLTQWYGQTETFVLSNLLVSRCGPPPPGSVGRPHAGLQAKVLDLETGKCLGPGVDGELCFKGWPVIKDFADEEGWIHTGDVGHYDADGNFYIVDRIKELIKYRGAHVSPSELEAWLLAHPQVSEAVVLGIPHDEDQEHPAAFVMLAAGATVTTDDLKQLVKEKACGSEEKLLRGGVFVLDSIPRLPTGKISRGQVRSILQERITREV
ncbi:luciferin 4-monooxygenase-like [Schistocerca gregaria]|uniref:luciferin 4-monooxygenase-like n=1 Tax=Schistocerca gregaria TaxID=7010 RepID=UPI00211DFA50|nr:luciferin 4-monooxygenase-like [Schistocerca gregaria]